MKRCLLLLTALFVLSLEVLGSGVQAASITIGTPTAGSTLNCTVTVQVNISLAPGPTPPQESQTTPTTLQITDSLGHQSNMSLTQNGGTTGTWNTLAVPNGSVTLIASFGYLVSGNMNTKFAYSPAIVVTVKNGYVLATDPTKTYAKVNSPTSGQAITANGAPFTLNTDHLITWTRFDGCGTYGDSYSWQQATTWQSITIKSDPASGSYSWYLPQGTGDWSKSKLGWANTYTTGLPIGSFTADAYTYEASSQVAHGSNPFTMVHP